MISGVPSDKARLVWPLVEPILRRTTDRTNGRFTTDDVLQLVETGHAQLWVGGLPVDTACITEIVDYPRQRWCRISFVAGEMDRIHEGRPIVEAWARSKGCIGVEIEGRPGWQRALSEFDCEGVLLRRRL